MPPRQIKVGNRTFTIPDDPPTTIDQLNVQDIRFEMEGDDLSGGYLEHLDDMDSAQADKLAQSLLEDESIFGVKRPPPDEDKPVNEPRGLITDIPIQAIGGARDAIVGAGQTVEAIADWARENIIEDPGGKLQIKIPEVSGPQTKTGKVVRPIAEWLTAFITSRGLLKKTGITKAWVTAPIGGAMADIIALDPDEDPGLVALVKLVPALKNPLSDFLESDPNDPVAQKKFKQVLDGLVAGSLVDGVFKAIRMAKAIRSSRKATEAFTKAKAKTTKNQATLDKILKDENTPPGLDQAVIDADNKAVRKLAEGFQETVETQRRGVRPRATARVEAAKLGMTIDDVLAISPGTTMNDSQIIKMLTIMEDSTNDIVDLARLIKNGGEGVTPEVRKEFLKKMLLFGQLDPKRLGVLSETGRALGILNEPMATINRQMKQLEEVLLSPEKWGLSYEKLVDMVSNLQNPRELREFARATSRPDFKEFFLEYWINSMLSGLTTPVVNFTGNTISMVMGVGERKLAEILGSGVANGEARSMLYGMVEAMNDVWAIAWRTMRTGESLFGNNKLEYARKTAITGDNLGVSGPLGTAVDTIGTVVRVPGRILLGTDEFFKYINYRMQLHALALTRTVAKLGDEATAEAIGKDVKRLIRELPEDLQNEAKQFADYQTFTNNLGRLGQKGQEILQEFPQLRLIVPFFRTPVNLFKYSFERTPVLQFASKRLREDLRHGGRRAAIARSKIATSSIVGGLVATMATNGLITGAGPSDPRERAGLENSTDWQAFSIKIGDTWFRYNRLDPIGMTIGTIASIVEDASNMDQLTLDRIIGATVLALSQNMFSKTYVKGLADFIETVTPKSHMRPEDVMANKRNYVHTLLGSMVPGLSAGLARAIDPGIKDVNTMLERVKSRIPFASLGVRNQLDVWGDERLKGGSGIYRAFVPIDKRDVVKNEIKQVVKDNKILIGMPANRIGGVRLKRDEYWDYVKIAGEEASKLAFQQLQFGGLKNLTGGPDGGKARLLKSIHFIARKKAAIAVLQKHPALRRAIAQKNKENAEALLGQELPGEMFSMESLAEIGGLGGQGLQ